eukprot:CAMPEP_0172533574 /NCGR_PEP_ID=MMETSP1067-20121228/6229_1 /TAXON_ID=265564 ORGANISM="Thalassiosira punctigera, Strain Tpunct2005C2" /NCGR_SAMPLE_ID=MMETSP1067 /ASSEMBLY_ACC=CAM_ASM_000444 /LENGTH=90 /DNA_ID=CAMNT_0013318227 /DNA_START=95 /DNA_END=367 /DNA_ORIENTATION=+
MPQTSGHTTTKNDTDAASSREEKKKVLVPRKKLQSVPDLLSNGYEEASAAESTASKVAWMTFLLVMFYVSLEIFLRATKKGEGPGSESEL